MILLIKTVAVVILIILLFFVSQNLTPDKKLQSYIVGVVCGIIGAIVGSLFTDPK